MPQAEDTAAGFVAIITLVLNLLPSIANTPGISPNLNAALISIALILKTTLGYINVGQTSPPSAAGVSAPVLTQAPVAAPASLPPGVYAIAGRNSTGGSFTGSYQITTTQSDAEAALAKVGLTNITWGAKIG